MRPAGWGARLARASPVLAVAGGAVAASLVVAPTLTGVLGAMLAIAMIAIAAVDARHYIIPDELTIAAFLIGLVHALVAGPSGSELSSVFLGLARGLGLGAAFLLLREGYFRLRKRHGLGLGDVKLAVVAGVWLALAVVPVAIELAALSAIATYLLRQLVLRRPVRATARLPFGLFLAPSIWVAWLIERALRLG
jgi:leader peptidase (prepilin peptidase)/N-methyltransferase